MIQKFEVGKRYSMRSACDHECIWSYIVVSRTESTVVLQECTEDGIAYGDTARFRINKRDTEYMDAEAVRPLGSYSMCPILTAIIKTK